MNRNASRAVTGAMLTGATVMGVDAIANDADAAAMTSIHQVPFSVSVIDVNPAAMTCCPGFSEDVLLPAFNPARGQLQGVELQFNSTQVLAAGSLESFSSEVMLFSQSLGSTAAPGAFNLTLDLLAGGLFSIANFSGARFPLVLAADVDFGDQDSRGQLDWSGTAQITYLFDDSTAIPAPPALFLFASAVAVTVGAGGRRRARAHAGG